MEARRRKVSGLPTTLPSDAELVAYITKPVRSHEVARYFGVDGRACLQRMRRLASKGLILNPYYSIYAPTGASIVRPLQQRQARIVALLDQPRSAAELSHTMDLGYSVTHLLQELIKTGHVVHCGPHHYVRAELGGQFEPRRPVVYRGESPRLAAFRAVLLKHTEHPRTVEELAALLHERRDLIHRQLSVLMTAGQVTVARMGGKGRPRVFSRVEPKRSKGT